MVAWHGGDLESHREETGITWHALASVVWWWQVLWGESDSGKHFTTKLNNSTLTKKCNYVVNKVRGLCVVGLQVSADKLDSITAFSKFFNQSSYTKLASYRRAIFQALEVRRFIGCMLTLMIMAHKVSSNVVLMETWWTRAHAVFNVRKVADTLQHLHSVCPAEYKPATVYI